MVPTLLVFGKTFTCCTTNAPKLLDCTAPFLAPENATREDKFEQIKSGWFEFPEEYWGAVSAEAKELITLCLDVDPDSRPPARRLLKHRWYLGGTVPTGSTFHENVVTQY